jgi:hypothetical protein
MSGKHRILESLWNDDEPRRLVLLKEGAHRVAVRDRRRLEHVAQRAAAGEDLRHGPREKRLVLVEHKDLDRRQLAGRNRWSERGVFDPGERQWNRHEDQDQSRAAQNAMEVMRGDDERGRHVIPSARVR